MNKIDFESIDENMHQKTYYELKKQSALQFLLFVETILLFNVQ